LEALQALVAQCTLHIVKLRQRFIVQVGKALVVRESGHN
jgi:hypothetical protein